MTLTVSDLVHDPIFGSIGFLNEIMLRYPEAISFAPGAPFLDDLDRSDVVEALDTFLSVGGRPATAWKHVVEYGPSQGIINDMLARSLNDDFGIRVTGRDLVVTVGAQEGFLLTLRALLDPERDLLAYLVPCFPGIRGAAAFVGVGTVPIEEGPDLLALRGACAQARIDGRRLAALYVAPDFSNPSGAMMSAQARDDLLALAEAEDFLLIEDSTYGFSATDLDAVPSSLKARDRNGRVIHIGTLAKICFPGARVGFVVADQATAPGGEPLATRLAMLKNMTTVNTSPLTQAVVAGLLMGSDGSLAAHGQTHNKHYVTARAALIEALDRHLPDARELGIEWTRPTGGFFVMLHTPVLMDHAALAECATEYRVLWTPMADFYPAGGRGTRSLRLSCSYLTTDRIDEGVGRLASFLRARCLRRRE